MRDGLGWVEQGAPSAACLDLRLPTSDLSQTPPSLPPPSSSFPYTSRLTSNLCRRRFKHDLQHTVAHINLFYAPTFPVDRGRDLVNSRPPCLSYDSHATFRVDSSTEDFRRNSKLQGSAARRKARPSKEAACTLPGATRQIPDWGARTAARG